MNRLEAKRRARVARKKRVRKKIRGTSQRPRLTVYKSLKHIYAQIIDDATGRTLVAASTVGRDLRGDLKATGNIEAARAVGLAIGRKALARDIDRVVFDRNGYLYHGKVKALAEAAREAGLRF
ncbi:50S ribosomal protein L18 [Deferrisoma camini]|uniref:50S ribosomal protein L18 n=1 Tax=Deferrisoma camini TaxID=1035120 RepID=UPI0004A4A6CD|nr:50S ribosomal protein L18 [Deferrisoma camini]